MEVVFGNGMSFFFFFTGTGLLKLSCYKVCQVSAIKYLKDNLTVVDCFTWQSGDLFLSKQMKTSSRKSNLRLSKTWSKHVSYHHLSILRVYLSSCSYCSDQHFRFLAKTAPSCSNSYGLQLAPAGLLYWPWQWVSDWLPRGSMTDPSSRCSAHYEYVKQM